MPPLARSEGAHRGRETAKQSRDDLTQEECTLAAAAFPPHHSAALSKSLVMDRGGNSPKRMRVEESALSSGVATKGRGGVRVDVSDRMGPRAGVAGSESVVGGGSEQCVEVKSLMPVFMPKGPVGGGKSTSANQQTKQQHPKQQKTLMDFWVGRTGGAVP